MVDSIKNTLVQRDEISAEEAQEQIDMVKSDIMEIAESGGSLMEIEDLMMDDLGLEPDYLEEILFDLM
jgi:hypothetical protein